MVIAEALQIGSHHFIFDEEPEEQEPEEHAQEELESTELPQENEMDDLPVEAETYEATLEINAPEREATSNSYVGCQSYVKWSKEYQEARKCLYGSEETAPDFERAFQLFQQEAEKGNALAMYDLARMFADGLGREADPMPHRIGMQKRLLHLWKQSSRQKKGRSPICSTGLGKCMRQV